MPGKSILIVEDDAIVAMTLEDTLHEMGYSVTGQAANAEDAIRIAGDKRPDLILMDIHIQGDRDGIVTAEEINQRFNIPIVYLTAYSDDETIQRAARTRPYGFLTKPFRWKEMYSTIEMALYKHRVMHQDDSAEPVEVAVPASSTGEHTALPSLETAVLDSIGMPVFVLSRDMRLIYYNQPLETFFSKTGCLDPRLRRSLFEIAPPSVIGLPKDYRLVFETGRPCRVEKILNIDGHEVVIGIGVTTVSEAGMPVEQVVGVIRDITRERAADRKAVAMNQYYEDLLAKVGGIMRITRGKENMEMKEINGLVGEIVILLAKIDPKKWRGG